MPKFEISNIVSAVTLGIYEGADESEALDAMARDAGYSDYRNLCSITDPDDLDAELERCRAELSVVAV
jgi:hypothetical protein